MHHQVEAVMHGHQHVSPMIAAQNAWKSCGLSLIPFLTLRSAGTAAARHSAASLQPNRSCVKQCEQARHNKGAS